MTTDDGPRCACTVQVICSYHRGLGLEAIAWIRRERGWARSQCLDRAVRAAGPETARTEGNNRWPTLQRLDGARFQSSHGNGHGDGNLCPS